MPKKNKRNTRRARKKRITKEMMRQQIAQRKVDIEIQEDASMDSATESSDAPIVVTVTTPDGSAVSPTTFKKFFNPSSMGRLREKVFGSRKATKEEMVLRRELIKIVGSAQSTQKLIMQNMRVLEELAKSNEDVAKMLENYNDPKTKQLFEKVLTGQELFPDEVQNLVGNLQTFTTSLREVGVALEVPLPEIVKQIGTMVGDNRIDIESRRDMIADLQQVVKASGVDSDNTKALLKISAKDLNFTEEDNTTLKKILDKLPSEVEGVKQKETFEELNKKMGSLVLTNEELNDFLQKKDEAGGSNISKLLKGLGAQGSGIKQGLIQTAFAAVGLGGVGELLGELDLSDGLALKDMLGKGKGGKLFGKLGGLGKGALGKLGATRMGSGASSLMGKAGGLVKGLGKFGRLGGGLAAGGALAAGFEGYDAYNEYQGLKESGATETELTKSRNKGIGKTGGAFAGALGGAAAGAAIGSVVPVVGTAIGGLVGGAIGAWGGAKGGGALGEMVSGDTISRTTVDLIKKGEGYRATPYDDGVGNPTIGYGHLIKGDSWRAFDSNKDNQLDPREADLLLQDDIKKHQGFKKKLKVPITAGQEAALTSLAFNLGNNHSAVNKIVDMINNGADPGMIAQEFTKYDKARDQRTGQMVSMRGLTNRRNEEAGLFMGGSMSAQASSIPDQMPVSNADAMVASTMGASSSTPSPALAPAPSVIMMPPQQKESVNRKVAIDDFGLSVMNSAVFG